MKKVNFLIVIISILLLIAYGLSSCSKKEQKKEFDVVNDIIPVSNTLTKGFDMKAFREADSITQNQMLLEGEDLLRHNIMALYPEVEHPNWIVFHIGSGRAEGVQSGDGNTYDGNFNNEIIVEITKGPKKGFFFLACANGMLRAEYDYFRTHTDCRYVVSEGESLYSILETLGKNELWMSAAQQMDLGIRDKSGKMASYDTYSRYLGKYYSMLRSGDILDFCFEEVYDSRGRVIDFEKRQEETERANKSIKKRKR